MKNIDVLVIGASASGLMCAIEAAKRKRSVLIIDHSNKVGKKILMSGGGRCNFTNSDVSAQHFISHNPHFCKSALSRYTPLDFIALVELYGIAYHEKKLGQLFCTHKSKDIVNMLVDECTSSGVKIQLHTNIHTIARQNQYFVVHTNQQIYRCQSLVVATGGLSIGCQD